MQTARTQTFSPIYSHSSFHRRSLTDITAQPKLAESKLWMMLVMMMVIRKQRKTRRMKSSFTEPLPFTKWFHIQLALYSHSNLRGDVVLLTSQLRQHHFRKFVTPFRTQEVLEAELNQTNISFLSKLHGSCPTSELINKWLFHAIQMHLLAALMTLHH